MKKYNNGKEETNWNHIIAQVFFTDLYVSSMEKSFSLIKCYTNDEAVECR